MSKQPIKVLHILGSLDRGGAETWTVQMLGHLDRHQFHCDVLVHRPGGVYEPRVKELGCKVFYCGNPSQGLRYLSALRQLLAEQGPYDIVHSHLQLFSGLILWMARRARVQGRIAHARNSYDGHGHSLFRWLYRAGMRSLITSCATHLLAVSEKAARGAFGTRAAGSGRCELMTGLEFSPFLQVVDHAAVRAQLGIPADTLVIGHVGSFRPQKNHEYLLKIADALWEHRRDAVFVLAGDGALKPTMEQQVRSVGRATNFRFVGERDDIPALLQAMDVFVFPSLYEGLPRALVEAQIAGLPCVASDRITRESAAPGRVRFLALEQDPACWAEAILGAAQEPPLPASDRTVANHFEARGLTITANVEQLIRLYQKIQQNAQ